MPLEEFENVEFLPEPEDARILSAIDPAAVGFQGAWRAEVTGWAPLQAAPIQRRRRRRSMVTNGLIFAILTVTLFAVWNSGFLLVELSLPDSQWANDQAQLTEAADEGLTGLGVRVCMVDTASTLPMRPWKAWKSHSKTSGRTPAHPLITVLLPMGP